MESSAANHLFGDESKPALHLIEPGAAGRCEVEVEPLAFAGFEPPLDHGAFVRTVVVQNEMDVELRGHLLFELIEKLDELFTAMARQATANNLAVQDVEGGKQRRSPMPLVVM